MKNNANIHQTTLVAFCLFFFSFGSLSAQRWVPSESSKGLLPPAYSITCVRVVDSLTIWALASHDGYPRVDTFDLRVLKTTNGGQTWEVSKYPSNLGHYGYVIDALDGTTALISAVTWNLGDGLQIAKTTDGGRTWTTTLPSFLPAYVHFFDRDNVAAVVPPGLANSTNGGTTWVKDTTMFDPTINDGIVNLGNGTNSFAARGDTMWIGTQIGFLYRSINKGRTFQTITSGINPDFYVVSIAFSDARNGMMTTNDSLYKLSIGTTKDGGTTWQFLPTTPDGFGSFPLLSAIPNTGAFVLTSDGYDPDFAGKSFVTTDMGKTWKSFKGRDVVTRAHEFFSKNVGWTGSIEISSPSTAAMYSWEPSTLFTPSADFFAENFNRGLPTTWTTSADAPKFMPCDSTCLKDFDTRNSAGFYDYIKRLDDPSDAATINSTFKSGAMALKMHRNTNINATLTSPAINCATKNKVYLQFSSIYWGGANADSVLSSGNASTNCAVRVSRDGSTWKDYKVLDFNFRYASTVFLDVSDVAANESRVFIQFRRTGAENNGIWAIDDVRLLDKAPLHDVTVSVDMTGQRVSAKGVYLANDLTPNGEWQANAVKMTDMGNSIYECYMSVPQLSTAHYKFMNGDSWGDNESVPSGCGMVNQAGGYDRVAMGKSTDYEMPLVCFGACMQCGDRTQKSVYEYCPRGDNDVIYCENFESMAHAKLVPQVSNWTTYALAINGYGLATAFDNPMVTSYWDGYVNYDGSRALRVLGDAVAASYDEPMMYLGNPTEGSYQVDFKIYVPKDRSAVISITDRDGNPGFTLDFSRDSLYLLEFLDYINFEPHLMAKAARYKQDGWNDVSLVFSPATNKIMVKLNGRTLLNAEDKSQSGYTFLDFSTFDIISEYGVPTEFYIDDILYKRIPNVALAQPEAKRPNVATISPNPANEELVISPDLATRDAWQVRLLNSVGQVVLTEQGNADSSLTIATNAYKSGIYFVEFKSETAQWTKKVVIQH